LKPLFICNIIKAFTSKEYFMKKIVVLILSILTLLGLAACGESAPKKL
jgi:hypothetical protein